MAPPISAVTVKANRVAALRSWLESLIEKFRIEAETLKEAERAQISIADRYLRPCQIEVIWIEDPEYQIVIDSNFEDRKDKEIIIDGPYAGSQLIDAIEELLKEERWCKPLPKSAYSIIRKGERLTLGDILSQIIVSYIGTIQNNALISIEKPSRRVGRMLVPNSFVWLVAGNMADMKQDEIIRHALDDAKRQAEYAQARPQLRAVAQAPTPKLKGHATYFFPTATIGPPPQPRGLKELLTGSYVTSFADIVVDTKLAGSVFVADRGGMLALTIEDKERAIKIFNTIFAVSLLYGIPSLALRESEIGTVELDPISHRTVGSTMPLNTLRMMAFQERNPWARSPISFRGSQEISAEKFGRILQTTERILDDEEITVELSFILEAYTHLSSAEYSPSFIISWILVERRLFNLWTRFLHTTGMPGKRRRKLTEHGTRSIDNVIESLALLGKLKDEEYKLLIELKDKRNDFVHAGSSITKADATKAYDLGSAIVEYDLSRLLETASIEELVTTTANPKARWFEI